MTLKRACSLLTVKSFSEDERVITGIASTPSPDRDGDILEPEGAEFGSAIPFLWQHDHSRPVGQCTVRRVSEGLEITATLVKPVPDMPSQLAARLDEVWAAIKTGLVRGLSVGFRPHEYTFLDGGGLHFLRWELMEVSAVTVPANAECTIRPLNLTTARVFCRVRQPETGGENRIFSPALRHSQQPFFIRKRP